MWGRGLSVPFVAAGPFSSFTRALKDLEAKVLVQLKEKRMG